MLAVKNAHERDAHISFEEQNHVYSIDGESNYKSVTTFIHDFFPHFNANLVLCKMKQSVNWNEENKYFGMTDNEIKKMWKDAGQEACIQGTFMHKNIENYYNGIEFMPSFIGSREHKLFQNFLADHSNYQPFRTEWSIYSKKYRLAGSIDMIFEDPSKPGWFIIADWKRCKEIKYTNKWEKGLGPLSEIDHCNYWHYAIQLNIYRMILVSNYKMKISEMFLVVLHPDQENYIKVPIPQVGAPIVGMLNDRLGSLKEKRPPPAEPASNPPKRIRLSQKEPLDTHSSSNTQTKLVS